MSQKIRFCNGSEYRKDELKIVTVKNYREYEPCPVCGEHNSGWGTYPFRTYYKDGEIVGCDWCRR